MTMSEKMKEAGRRNRRRAEAAFVPPDPERAEALIREIRHHTDAIVRLTAELGGPSRYPSSIFKRNALTREQFEAALRNLETRK